jgi:hypothetical protein
MGFFDNISFEDVGIGVAESVAAGIDQSVAQYQKNKDRLRDIEYTTRKDKRETFDKEISANSKLIKEAAAVFGKDGEDAVFSLIKSEGSLQAAYEAAMQLKKMQQDQGINPIQYIGLAESSPTGVTVNQLARYAATPLKVRPGPKAKDIATGFMSFIPGAGTRAAESIETGVRADMAAAGFEEVGSREEFLEGLPEARANELKPYMLGRLPDPQQEMNRLIGIQSNLFSQGKKAEADNIKNEVTRLAGVVTMLDKDNYTPNLSVLTKGNVQQRISDRYGLGGDYNAQGAWITATEDQQIIDELEKVGDYAEGFIEEAVKDGVSYGFATRKINEFIRKNKKFVYIANPDGFGPGEFKEVEGEILFDTSLVGEEPEDQGLVERSTTEDAEVGDPATAGSANQNEQDTQINRYRNMPDKNSTEAKALRAKILRSQGGAEKLAELGL